MAKKKKLNYQSHEPCLRCGEYILDRCYHHVKTKGSFGSDHKFNLMPLCDFCHTKSPDSVHRIGLTPFVSNSSKVEKWMIRNGWEFDDNLNKWIAPKDAVRDYL